MTNSVGYEGLGRSSGLVYAYNYPRDVFSNGETTNTMEHVSGNAFRLYEGNVSGAFIEDDTHGTHNLSTFFRNYSSGYYYPYTTNPNKIVFDFGAGNRFINAVGNVLGSSYMSVYEQYLGSTYNYVYGFDAHSSVFDDPLVQASSLRWANCDSVTGFGSCRYCGDASSPGWATTCSSTSEIPTALTGNAAPFNNSIPASTTLPPSFFLPTTAHPGGGTGLSWWKVCTQWTTFPTVCAATRVSAFPAVGPDVTGSSAPFEGASTSGHVYDIPAVIAFANLPVDTTYQQTFCISSSSWSSGVETLTLGSNGGCPGGALTSFPNITHVLGPFGVTGACSSASAPNGEFYMTDSTTTTVKYVAVSDPGSCAGGTVKFPNVRQFDGRVYQADSGGTSTPSGMKGKSGTKGKVIIH